MDAIKVLLAGAVAIGMATAVLLPDRQTPAVINSARQFVQGTLGTAIKGG